MVFMLGNSMCATQHIVACVHPPSFKDVWIIALRDFANTAATAQDIYFFLVESRFSLWYTTGLLVTCDQANFSIYLIYSDICDHWPDRRLGYLCKR